jgi:tetratricopeptide (TPR) repeat protein
MISNQPLIKKYAIILIAVIGILAYANSFTNSFQFDDGYHIVEGTKIRNLDNYFTLAHWKNVGNRPLAFLTLAVDYQLAPKDAQNVPLVYGFHISNLIFHILAGFMAFLLTMEILSQSVFKKNKVVSDYKVLIAFFTAAIFVAHPIQTQAVTYIIQRMAVLAGFFYMWSILLYIKGRNEHMDPKLEKAWKPWAYYGAAFFAGFLAFVSKQNAITFPIAFILTEIFFIRDKNEKIDRRFLIISSSIIGGVILLALLVKGIPVEYDKMSRSEYLLTQFRVIPKYWQLLFLPINQHLDYYFPVSTKLNIKESLGLLFILLTMALAAWLYLKKWYVAAFGIFWFYLSLSVESSIIPIRDVIFEHRLYLALYGFAFAISYLAFYFLSARKAIYPVIALSLLSLIYIGASINRNAVWKTPFTLWSDSVKKSPKRERAWYWLATYYTSEKDLENAMKCYNTSIECNPAFPLAYNGRANLEKQSNDMKAAIKDYDKAIQLDPKYATAFYNRGITYAAMDKLDKAIADYDMSIKCGNKSSAIYYNRGNAKRRNKNYQSALTDYDIAIKKNPKHSLSYFNRGLTKASLSKHEDAVKDIDSAIKLDPNNHLFYNGKGVSLISLKRYPEAISNFTYCIKLNPNFGQAYYNRGYAKQVGLNDKNGACADWQVAASKGYAGANYYLNQYCKK